MTDLMSQSSKDIEEWNRVAEQYALPDHAVEPTTNPMYTHMQAVFWETLGNLKGHRVLDLGCGDGWLSSLMDKAGAQVIGIDGSTRLLELAQERYPQLTYVQWDLAQGLPEQLARFDCIVSTMVLMDIPDLTLLMRDLRSALTEDGRLIFVILHPCFYGYKRHYDPTTGEWYRKVTNYYDPQIWRVESFGGHNHYHRNLTYYTELLRTNGFAITRLFEPAWESGTDPNEAYLRHWPVTLLIEARPFMY